MVVRNKMVFSLWTIMIVTVLSWEILYFSIGEGVITGLSICISFHFLSGWYQKVTATTGFYNQMKLRLYLYLLPAIPIILNVITLRTLASWDVTGAAVYVLMYLLMGVAWLALTLNGMLLGWSFSYEDDVLMGENPAGVWLLTGAVLGSSLIYAGANIGDGPGWWTVVFAGGLGTISWLLLGASINKWTGIIDTIASDNDAGSGIRMWGYLIASGFILSRASAGDWTSFTMTVVEFLSGWPVLLLALAMVVTERSLFDPTKHPSEQQATKTLSAAVTACYLLYAVIVVFLLPAIF